MIHINSAWELNFFWSEYLLWHPASYLGTDSAHLALRNKADSWFTNIYLCLFSIIEGYLLTLRWTIPGIVSKVVLDWDFCCLVAPFRFTSLCLLFFQGRVSCKIHESFCNKLFSPVRWKQWTSCTLHFNELALRMATICLIDLEIKLNHTEHQVKFFSPGDFAIKSCQLRAGR